MFEERSSFPVICTQMRTNLKNQGEAVLRLKKYAEEDAIEGTSDKGEMIANIMLAYRHIEDASMRLGKVIAAYEGDTKINDKRLYPVDNSKVGDSETPVVQ